MGMRKIRLQCIILLQTILKRRQPSGVCVTERLIWRSLSHWQKRPVEAYIHYAPGNHARTSLWERWHASGFRRGQQLWWRLIKLTLSATSDRLLSQPWCEQRRFQMPSVSLVARLLGRYASTINLTFKNCQDGYCNGVTGDNFPLPWEDHPDASVDKKSYQATIILTAAQPRRM